MQSQLVAFACGPWQHAIGELLPRGGSQRTGAQLFQPLATLRQGRFQPATGAHRRRGRQHVHTLGLAMQLLRRRQRRRLSHEALQVVGTTGFGARSRQPLPAERLHTHHRTDDVAVDVNIAHVRRGGQGLCAAVDAGLDAHGQAVVEGIDAVDELGRIALPTHHLQDRAKDLGLHIRDILHFEHLRRDRVRLRAGQGRIHRYLQQRAGFTAQSLHMALDVVVGLPVNHRPEVGGEGADTSHTQFLGSPFDHLDHAVGHGLVYAQQAQGRTALPCAAEGTLHHRIGHLFGQRRAVHQHHVDAARLRNQRCHRAVFFGQRTLDDLGDLGRAGEHHPRHPGLRHQRGAHGFTGAVQQLQRIGRHTVLMHQLDRHQGNGRGLLGGFGQHGVAGDQRRGDLTAENGQREIPGTDAHPGTHRRVARRLLGDALGFVGVVAQEVHRLAHFGHRVRPGLEGFLDQHAAQRR